MRLLAYLFIYLFFGTLLWCLPVEGGYVWDVWFINSTLAALFTLLVWLSARLAGTNGSALGVLTTALFLLLFCPGGDKFMQRDEGGLLELASQCMVPFFMGQFQRIRRKDFRWLYSLMLLMGVFCSYTHNGITIPMCVSFLLVSLRERERFFRMACWPMVVGVVIGTALSVWTHFDDVATSLQGLPAVASVALRTLWDTKVFVLSIALTAYLSTTHSGRRTLLYISRRHFVLSQCALTSLLILPLAPLGIDNAITGVCFFHMFWVLFLGRDLVLRHPFGKL